MKILLKDIKSARWAIIAIIAYFVILKKYIYTMCPTVLITGYPCPGCGMTRAAFKILRLDFAGAWKMHPFIYPIIIFAIIFVIYRYVLGREELKTLVKIAGIIGFFMILFYIWRMTKYFPGDPPMSYYSGNYLNRIRELFHIFLH